MESVELKGKKEVHFLWDWWEVNNSRKLRREDESSGSVGSDPGNLSDIFAWETRIVGPHGLAFPLDRFPLADRISWPSLQLESMPASGDLTDGIFARNPLKTIINYLSNYWDISKGYKIQKLWKSPSNYLLIIRASDSQSASQKLDNTAYHIQLIVNSNYITHFS